MFRLARIRTAPHDPVVRLEIFAALLIALVLALAPVPGFAAGTTELAATRAEREALEAIEEGLFVRGRELASRVLADDPSSVPARYALAVALHDGEGNVPLALRYLREARRELETDSGTVLPGFDDWHQEVIWRESQALSDLGLDTELLSAYRRLRDTHGWEPISVQVWPLMKLGRIAEARAVAKRAIATGDRIEILIAKNGLCAMDGYPACIDMLDAARKAYEIPGLALGNAALSAMEIGRYDEAERYLLEATRDLDLYSNPWRHLTGLYVLQARLGEAVDAARAMLAFGRELPARVRQHQEGQDLVVSAELLLVAGHPERALAASSRVRERPDRTSHLSGSDEELAAEAALLDRRIRFTIAERALERASIAPLVSTPGFAAGAALHRFEAWLSSRRVAPLLHAGGLRPALHRTEGETLQFGAPDWLYPDAVEIFGPGPTRVLLDELRERAPADEARFPKRLWNANLDALEAEASFLAGDARGCLESGVRAREGLPRASVLLQARLALRMAECARALGLRERAYELFGEVLAADPGAFRRFGVALPAGLSTSAGDETSARAARLAFGTRRFASDNESPFAIVASGPRLCLSGAGGAQLACVEVPPAAPQPERAESTSEPEPPRALFENAARAQADALLERAFAPRLDLSQMDLRGLDGTPVIERGIDEGVARELMPLN